MLYTDTLAPHLQSHRNWNHSWICHHFDRTPTFTQTNFPIHTSTDSTFISFIKQSFSHLWHTYDLVFKRSLYIHIVSLQLSRQTILQDQLLYHMNSVRHLIASFILCIFPHTSFEPDLATLEKIPFIKSSCDWHWNKSLYTCLLLGNTQLESLRNLEKTLSCVSAFDFFQNVFPILRTYIISTNKYLLCFIEFLSHLFENVHFLPRFNQSEL